MGLAAVFRAAVMSAERRVGVGSLVQWSLCPLPLLSCTTVKPHTGSHHVMQRHAGPGTSTALTWSTCAHRHAHACPQPHSRTHRCGQRLFHSPATSRAALDSNLSQLVKVRVAKQTHTHTCTHTQTYTHTHSHTQKEVRIASLTLLAVFEVLRAAGASGADR